MTAILTAPPIEQVAPSIVPRVRPGDLRGPQNLLLGLGALLLVGSCVLGMGTGTHDDQVRFYHAYLVAFMFTLGIQLGALFFTLIQHITRAGWSISLRRVAENVMWTLPWMALLFVPVMVGFNSLFQHWADPALVDPANPAFDAVIAGKSGWLNKPFFGVRVGVYFLCWIGLAFYFRRASLRQDETGDPAISLRLARVAAPALLLFALSLTFAAFDWIMSLNPHWFSTIFGVTYFAGAFMAFLAFLTLLCKFLERRGYLRGAVTTEHYHDLGKLLFAFMVFWTYVNFSQYMLIWYANLPEETRFFAVRREHGGWGAVGTLLIFGHFLVPFAFLMSRHMKRRSATLIAGAAFLLLMHWIDMQYLILPNAAHGADGATAAPADAGGLFGPFAPNLAEYLHGLGPLDVTTLLGMVLLVTGLVLLNVRRTNLLPTRDPRLVESLTFHNF